MPTKPAPKNIAERLELTSSELARRLFARRQAVRGSIDGQPYRGVEMSDEDRLGRYTEVRDDVDAWLELMNQNFRVKSDGRVLVRKGMMQEIETMEKTLREGVL